jgi:hypothetical protein
MRLALDILEGQNLARKNDHRIGPRRAGASELAAVDALDRDRQFVESGGADAGPPAEGARAATGATYNAVSA